LLAESPAGVCITRVRGREHVEFCSLFCLLKTGSYVAQAGLKLTILPQPLEYWDYSWVLPCPVFYPS
jgi:hypothetical protein